MGRWMGVGEGHVPCQVVDPAFFPELGHAGVNEGVARPGFFPGGKEFGILSPRDLCWKR